MIRASLALLLLALPALRAGEPKWTVVADLKIVDVPKGLALPLVAQLKDETTAPAGHEELARLLQTGEAALVKQARVQTADGRGGSTEDVRELRFAVEWVFILPQPNISPPGVRYAPVSIETKWLGLDFQFEPSVDEQGRIVLVNFSDQQTTLATWDRPLPAYSFGRVQISRVQPRFADHRTQSQIRAPSGRWLLIGSYASRHAVGGLELHLARFTAIRSNTPER